MGALYDRAAAGLPDHIDLFMDFLKKQPTWKLKLLADALAVLPEPPSIANLGPHHLELFHRVTVLEPDMGVSGACAAVASEDASKINPEHSDAENVRRQYYRVKEAIGPPLGDRPAQRL